MLAIANLERLNRMQDDRLSSIYGLALLAEPAQITTRIELDKMSLLCSCISRQLLHAGAAGIDEDFVENISIASLLHDVGNSKMPVALLLKPEKLTVAECETLSAHTHIGAEILSRMSKQNKYLLMAAEIAACHHEHFDGKGYPDGLHGEHIPLAARIVAVVDSYIAMTSKRPYREALNPALALLQISQESGKRFEPSVVDAFLAVTADFLA